eukprot:325541-Alexandrium_andersonii.AAC.1
MCRPQHKAPCTHTHTSLEYVPGNKSFCSCGVQPCGCSSGGTGGSSPEGLSAVPDGSSGFQ